MPPQLQAFPASITRAWRRCLFSVHLSGVLTTWKPGNFLVYFTYGVSSGAYCGARALRWRSTAALQRRDGASPADGAGRVGPTFNRCQIRPGSWACHGPSAGGASKPKKVDCRSPKRSTASTFEENQSPNLIVASHQPSPCLRHSQKPGSRLPRSATARSMRSIKSRETPSACTRPA